MIHARTRSLGRLLACMHPRFLGAPSALRRAEPSTRSFFDVPKGWVAGAPRKALVGDLSFRGAVGDLRQSPNRSRNQR